MSNQLHSTLAIYLNDHLAMVVGESELIERVANENEGSELAAFLAGYLASVEKQASVVEMLIEQLGEKPSKVKQSAAWLAEKAGRLKLNDSLLKYTDLARLLETEVLIGAATARRGLWETLKSIDAFDRSAVDPSQAAAETKQQIDELYRWHEQAAQQLTRLGNR